MLCTLAKISFKFTKFSQNQRYDKYFCDIIFHMLSDILSMLKRLRAAIRVFVFKQLDHSFLCVAAIEKITLLFPLYQFKPLLTRYIINISIDLPDGLLLQLLSSFLCFILC